MVEFLKAVRLIIKLVCKMQNLVLLIVATRLVFVEPNEIAKVLEILGTLAAVAASNEVDTIDD
jgi:hypothetical protein